MINNLKKLKADYLLIDLGSGSSFNTLDFFSISYKGLLVSSLEYTALINLLTFVKNLALRRIEVNLPNNSLLKGKLNESLNKPVSSGILTLNKVIHSLSEIDNSVADDLKNEWQKFRPRIIFNQGRHPDDLVVVEQLNETMKRNLSLKCDFFGHIFFDAKASESLRRRRALKEFAPKSWIVEDIELLTDRIIRIWDQPLKNSSTLLKNNTLKIFEERKRKLT